MSILAELLEKRREEIVQHWTAEVERRIAPGPRSQTELRDHIPDFLVLMGAKLRRPPSLPPPGAALGANQIPKEHGRQRYRVGFSVEALVRDYGVLLQMILDFVDASDAHVTLAEVRVLVDFVSEAIAEGVAEYTHQREQALRAAQEAALRRDAQLATILRSISDAVIATDATGRVTFLNPMAEALTGWTQPEVEGRPLREVFRVVDEQTHRPVESPVDRVLSEGVAVGPGNPTLLVHRAGAELPVDDRAAPIRGGDGALAGVVLVFRDVTTSRRKDAELRTFHALIEASSDYISFGSPDGQIEYLNPAGRRLIGLVGSDETSRLNAADVFTLETSAQTMAAMFPPVLAGEYYRGETTFRSFQSDEAIPMLQDAFAIRGSDREVLSVATISRDLREHKGIEAERERLLLDAQEARAEAEAERQKLNSLFEQAPVGICILEGPRHTFTFANPAYHVVVGERELVGKPLLEALPALKGQGLEVLLDEVMTSGKPFIGDEVPIRVHENNEIAYYNFVYQPKRDAQGNVDGVLVCGSEVTAQVHARKRAESEAAARRKAEERLRRLIEVTKVGSWEFDSSTRAVVVDARFREMFGLTPEEPFTLDKSISLLHDEDCPRVTQALADALAGKDGGRYELEYRTRIQATGAARWVSVWGQTDFDGEGKAVRVLGTAMDITDRNEAELSRAALLEALAQQPSLQVSVGEGPELVFTMANSIFQEEVAHGRPVLGRPMMEVFPELKSQGFEELLQSVMETGQPFVSREARVEIDRGDGTLREAFYNLVYQPVRGPSGRFESILSISHEVTDIVHAREHAARVAEEEKERAAFEQQLIGIVSHDLRNPLGAILFGTSMLLGRKDLEDKTRKTIRRIHASAERAIALVKDVLDFTQARLGGGLPVRRAPMDAHAVAQQVAEELQVNFAARQIRVEAVGDGSGEWDFERLAQVLMNLASNALKYGRVTAPVILRTRGDGDSVVLEVHNENAGAPIPQEAMARLFEPLQRGTTQADQLGRSVGLGLYIVKHIVEAHGGTIGVTSSAEAGTTFTVRLPRRAEPSRALTSAR